MTFLYSTQQHFICYPIPFCVICYLNIVTRVMRFQVHLCVVAKGTCYASPSEFCIPTIFGYVKYTACYFQNHFSIYATIVLHTLPIHTKVVLFYPAKLTEIRITQTKDATLTWCLGLQPMHLATTQPISTIFRVTINSPISLMYIRP